MKRKSRLSALLWMLLIFPIDVLAQDTVKDAALWSGGLLLQENESGLNYSVEYQLRLDNNMSSFSNHFVEFMGYSKAGAFLLLNGGYRFTQRTYDTENRLYLGGFLDLTGIAQKTTIQPDDFKMILQVGYQHDFSTTIDDTPMDSNSIRWVLVTSKPATKTITPFLLAGILTTWNRAYSFGIDKIRLGGGVAFQLADRSRFRMQYIWEQARFMTPQKHTNILWLRYEATI